MAAGTDTYEGLSAPLYGDFTLTGRTAATDQVTLKQVAAATGKTLSIVDSSDTHRFAVTAKADLIIIGSQGRTGLRRLMIGSVAERVVRHALCPVLVVR